VPTIDREHNKIAVLGVWKMLFARSEHRYTKNHDIPYHLDEEPSVCGKARDIVQEEESISRFLRVGGRSGKGVRVGGYEGQRLDAGTPLQVL